MNTKKYRHKKSYKTVKKRSLFDIFKIFKYRVCWISCLVLICLISLSYLFFLSSVFRIKSIEIVGIDEEMKNITNEEINKNIFLADLQDISRKVLSTYPQIVEVKIKRKLPDELLIEIKKREQVVAFCQRGSDFFLRISEGGNSQECFSVDDQGIVFKEISDLSDDVLIIKNEGINYLGLGQRVVDKNLLDQMLKINSKINDVKVREILLLSERKLKVNTFEGWKIYFNPKKDLDWQIEELNILLKEKISLRERSNLEYVDLRFKKVYIKRSN